MRDSILNAHPTFRDESDGPRENDPLRLFHDPFLENLGRIAVLYCNGLLENDRSGIESFVDEMNRRTGHLHTARKCFFMDVEPIAPFSAKTRDERRMNINNPVRILPDEFRRDRHKKTARTIRSGMLP